MEKEYSHLHSIEIITIFEETKTIEMTGNEPKIDIDKIVKHWIETSDSDFQTMLDLYKSKSYGWSLFLGHISTEKLLKALYLKKLNDHPPRTHNLYRLCELIQIDLSDEYADWLDEITSFNLNARYDDYKKEFYRLCTPDFTKSWIDKISTIRTWIKQML